MKKGIICLVSIILMLVMLLPLFSCVRSDKKYDYNMDKYLTLGQYEGFKVEVDLDSVQGAIDSYLLDYSTEYVVKKGDDIYVSVVAHEVKYVETANGTMADIKGNEITALKTDSHLIENMGAGNYAQKIEASVIGTKIGVKTSMKTTLPSNFYISEYAEKEIFIDITVASKVCKAGEVVVVNYTGYYIDENGNRIKNEDKKDDKDNEYKTFDEGSSVKFYLGSKMSIDGFEENIIGMKVNETKCFNATFPDDYSNADVKGKTVEFEVTVKSIYVPPIYDDEFVKKYFPDYKSVEEFETALKDRYILAAVYENVVKGTTIIKYPKAERNDALNELKNIEESFYDTYGVTLDSYIKSSFDMTREQYVENNMKSEMIYYAVAQKEGIEPTAEQLLAEVDSLIAYYKEYYMTNEGLDEATAKTKAMDFVDSLGASYSYENVLFALVDECFKKKADVTYKEKTYTSITEIIAEQNKPVTE